MIEKIVKEENITFVEGKGKRKCKLQKSIESLKEYLQRFKKYTKDLHIIGEHNSYSKTDNDAIFMKLKEDHMKNMDYCEDDDFYICKNNKKLELSKVINRKSKTGYKSEVICYTCEDCSNCKFKSSCIKGNNSNTPIEDRTKKLYVFKLFHEKRKDNLERITSLEGCNFRMYHLGYGS